MASENTSILSPAYGTILKVVTYQGFVRIAIFLSVTDNHDQFAPCDAVVLKQRYKAGEFNLAYLFKKSMYNERLSTLMETPFGNMQVIQIAGVVARTVRTNVKEGEQLQQGQKFGNILFGSRVDLILPADKVIVNPLKKGDKVKGGVSVLARWIGSDFLNLSKW